MRKSLRRGDACVALRAVGERGQRRSRPYNMQSDRSVGAKLVFALSRAKGEDKLRPYEAKAVADVFDK
jgi:hypothetical protein